MSESDEPTFAEGLQALRCRSGLSYADLARRTFTSASTMHRYCTGAGLPPEPDVVERIAVACGADTTELMTLVQRWKAAAAARAAGSPDTELRPGPGTDPRFEPPAQPPPDEPATDPLARRRGRRTVILVAAAAALVGGLGVVATLTLGSRADSVPDPAEDPGRPGIAVPPGPAGADVCAPRSGYRRADGPGAAYDAVWTNERVCPNVANAPIYTGPFAIDVPDSPARTGTMHSTRSWFLCWVEGRPDARGNRVWYYTQGDVSDPDHRDRRAWGFMPAAYLLIAVHPDPGMPACPG